MDLDDEIHLLKKAQIAHLKANGTPTKIPSKYADFADILSPKLTVELLKHMRINDHAIKFVNDWQLLYGPIYSLGLMKLEILMAYIKNNLAIGFIRPSKSPAKAFILYNKKLNGSLRLCIGY